MASGKHLRKAIKIKELSMEAAADKLGMSRSNLYFLVNKAELDDEVIQNVHTKLDIDLEEESKRVGPELPYHEQRLRQKLVSEPFMVPLVPVKARAGYIKSFDEIPFIDTLEKYALPPGVSPAGAIWRYFELGGDSMEPTFVSGDVILASQIQYDDWLHIRNFYVYIIITEVDIWMKNVYAYSQDEWILLSENEEMYEPFKIKVADVKELWLMRRHIKRAAPKQKSFDINEIIRKVDQPKPKKK